MSDIFKYIDAVSFSKEDLIRTADMPDQAEKEYSAFMTNRAMSYHIDGILYANEMNLRWQLPNICQFDYLINTLRKRKRFGKWAKAEKNGDLDIVMEYFGFGRAKAENALRVLTPEQIAMIKKKLYKGGENDKNISRGSGRNQTKES